jgi:hypothetical protein
MLHRSMLYVAEIFNSLECTVVVERFNFIDVVIGKIKPWIIYATETHWLKLFRH